MSVVPANVILIWTGANAAIPSGYSRETTLDSKFIKGTAADTDPADTGGSDSHTHDASASHSHTMSNHTHTVTVGNVSTGFLTSGSTKDFGVVRNHTHSAGSSGSRTGGSLSSEAATYTAESDNSLPPYHEVIFIKSDGSAGVPDDGICFYHGTTLPDNFYDCDGDNSTTDLQDKFLRGAGTGEDAGTTGGALIHAHKLDHTHTGTAHDHGNVTTGGWTQSYIDETTSTTPYNALKDDGKTHTHSINFATDTDSVASTNPTLTITESVQPEYKTLRAIQNTSGGELLPGGIIGMWIGTLATIPNNWILCDGLLDSIDMRGKYTKISTTAGSTGGSNTHTHTGNSHTHTATGTHTHTATNSTHSNNTHTQNTGGQIATGAHQHSISTGSATATYGSTTTAADSASGEPAFVTVAFIKYQPTNAPAFIFSLFM